MNPKSLYGRSVVIDGLYHSLLVDPQPGPPGTTLVDQLIDAGVTAINLSIIYDVYPTQDVRHGLASLYDHQVLFDAFPDRLIHVLAPEDVMRAKAEAKLGIIFGTQGTDTLERDIRWVSLFHRLGVRIMQLTYNEHTAAGSGCLEGTDFGLTLFGRQLIREMNRLGMVVDLSHVGTRTSLEAAELSDAPVIFSHSGVRRLVDHPRNLTDDQIRATAEKGGVIGLCPHSVMCTKDGSRPDVTDYLDQLDYVAQLVGPNHVGIGTDRFMSRTMYYTLLRTTYSRSVRGFFGAFSETEKHVKGFSRLGDWPAIADVILGRGYSEADVARILGGNFMRVLGSARVA